MKKSNEQPIGEAINEFLEKTNLKKRLGEVRLINSWEKVMGKMIAKHTQEIFISNRKLNIRLDSAALRQELSYAKDKIVKMLNDEAGEKIVDELILR